MMSLYLLVFTSKWQNLVSPYRFVVVTVPLSSLFFNYFELNKLPENMTPDIPKAVFIQYRLKYRLYMTVGVSLLMVIHHISNSLATGRETLKRCSNYKAARFFILLCIVCIFKCPLGTKRCL